jgi:hypothetical protein
MGPALHGAKPGDRRIGPQAASPARHRASVQAGDLGTEKGFASSRQACYAGEGRNSRSAADMLRLNGALANSRSA